MLVIIFQKFFQFLKILIRRGYTRVASCQLRVSGRGQFADNGDDIPGEDFTRLTDFEGSRLEGKCDED